MIYGLGMLESGITFDFGQLVLDCEIARMIKFTLNGIPVTGNTLAANVIREVGPFGDFLGHEHTLAGMRTQSVSELIDRRGRSAWETEGATDCYTRATAKARLVLETHKPEPLLEEKLVKIRSIIQETEMELGI